MSIIPRVAKSVRETDSVRHHDHEAVARSAVATVFNWLGEPSEDAVHAAAARANVRLDECRRVWSAMLAELRREAGF